MCVFLPRFLVVMVFRPTTCRAPAPSTSWQLRELKCCCRGNKPQPVSQVMSHNAVRRNWRSHTHTHTPWAGRWGAWGCRWWWRECHSHTGSTPETSGSAAAPSYQRTHGQRLKVTKGKLAGKMKLQCWKLTRPQHTSARRHTETHWASCPQTLSHTKYRI